MHIFEFDDPNMITQIHGVCALYSCFSVCLFHKTEGFFFKSVSNYTSDSVVVTDPVTNITTTTYSPMSISEQ
jgi:hypothetical protein